MPIEPNIALGYRAPQFESPVNQLGKAAELQYAVQRNQMNQMQMAALQKEEAANNALNAAYQAAYNPQTGAIDINALRKNIAGGGYGTKLPAIEKTLGEINKQKLDIEKLSNEIKAQPIALQEAQAKLVDTKLKQSRAFLDTLDPNDPDAGAKYIAWHEANHKDPVLGPELAKMGITAEASRANIERAMATPGGLQQLILQSKLGTEKFIEANKMHFVNQDFGGKIRTVGIEPLTGKSNVIAGTEIAKTKTPHEIAVEAQARERLTKEFSPDNVAHVITDAQGNVTLLNKQGKQVGTKLEGAGKPSATFEKTAAQQKQLDRDRDLVISELESAVKPGGLIDQSTGSGAGKLVDIGARFMGNATKGDIAIGQLQPIADLALKMIPRFEGPQSDKDTASYQQAAGQLADAGLPREVRKAAGKEVLRLMKARKGQFQTQDMASGNVAVPSAAPPAGFKLD